MDHTDKQKGLNATLTKENNKTASSLPSFEAELEKSKVLKDEANRYLKTNPNKALDKYNQSLGILLRCRPKLVNEKEDFLLEWRLSMGEEEKKQALELLAIIFSNCSHVYIVKRQPLMALYYAKFSLWCNPTFFKANLRIAKAMIDLLYLSPAEDLLIKLRGQKEAGQFQGEIEAMLTEISQLVKEYSSPMIIAKFLRGELDWEDEKAYIGPMELFYQADRNRGFLAKRDIARGELMLIERGFTYDKQNPEFCYHLLTKLNQREDIKALFMNLYPNRKYPLPKYLRENKTEQYRLFTSEAVFNSFTLCFLNFGELLDQLFP